MILKGYSLDTYEQRVVPSPGKCIYCGMSLPPNDLIDEHVIPFALGHNTLVYKKSSCRPCAEIIQPYEQAVLREQLGTFRQQVEAPSRTKKKDRPASVSLRFIEVDDFGIPKRDLCTRIFLLEEAPLVLNLWLLPEARIMRQGAMLGDDFGGPWSFIEQPRADNLFRKIAKEEGVDHVAVKVGEVNRTHFLRFLAKTAHAYACAELGIDGFSPYLNDAVLNRQHDLSRYVGGTLPIELPEEHASTTVFLSIGGKDELIAVFFRFYPQLNSPAYAVVVGERNKETDARVKAMNEHYV
jgi:hypothetical protein